MEEILGMMPGVDASKLKDAKIDQKATARVEAIIRSMTPRERRNPELLNASRKKRIAAGSGTTVQEVNRLLKQFEQSRQLMKRFAGMGRKNQAGAKASSASDAGKCFPICIKQQNHQQRAYARLDIQQRLSI